jgi:hypothetical protein
MTWAILRKATDKDYEILNARSKAFAERHGLCANDSALDYDMVNLLIMGMEDADDPRLARRGGKLRSLFTRVIQRATNETDATGIAHGYVGYWQE